MHHAMFSITFCLLLQSLPGIRLDFKPTAVNINTRLKEQEREEMQTADMGQWNIAVWETPGISL